MLVPSWGVYAGYELCEHEVRPGAEEYHDNEKYQLRPRDWSQPSLAPFLTRLNAIRRENPALHWLRNLRFHRVDNDAILCFSKRDPESGNTVLVLVSLDPANPHWTNTDLDLPALGLDWGDRMTVEDQLSGASFDWGQFNAVRLGGDGEPAHILTVSSTDSSMDSSMDSEPSIDSEPPPEPETDP
jgi:starch synthase (maltosyl-transferring)